MRRSFKLDLPPALRNRIGRDPKLVARIILGFLLLANLIAAFFVFQP